MNKPTVLKIRAAYVGLKVKAHVHTAQEIPIQRINSSMSTESLLGQHNTCHVRRLPGYTLHNSADKQLLVNQHSQTRSCTDQETIELGLPGNSPTSSHLCMTGLQSHIATTSAAHMSHINILSILVEKQPGHMPAGGK